MIITRFPPSPTGDLHIGGVRTALYNWLLAKKYDGKFILRIEDTDLERSSDKSVDGIIEGMNWLGLTYDEGPIFQTDRFVRYAEVIEQMLAAGTAYYCYCSKERIEQVREIQTNNKEKPKYDNHCRDNPNAKIDGVKPVIRFKNPLTGNVVWHDLVHGDISFANHELDDFIIARPDGSPTYNFCVVVDDIDMAMTHIIRGDDHINNTPKQINIFNALGAKLPLFGHVPMILGDDGKRLSKRHGAAGVLAYREAGYLPKAILNYLIRLGWSHGDQEVFSIAEMIEFFDIKDVNKAASAFNTEKLNWLNQQYLKSESAKDLLPLLIPHYLSIDIEADEQTVLNLIPFYTERAKTLKEIAEQTDWLFKPVTSYPEKAVKKSFHEQASIYLLAVKKELETVDNWQCEQLHSAVEKVVNSFEVGFGKVGMPLRLALTGGKPSPNIDEILYLLGKTKSILSIDNAIKFISESE